MLKQLGSIALCIAALSGCAATPGEVSTGAEGQGKPYPGGMKITQYPGSTVKVADVQTLDLSKLGAPNKTITTVMMITHDSPDKVYSYYKTELSQKGWQIKEQSNKSLAATKGSGDAEENISVGAADNGSVGTAIAVMQN